PQQPLFLAGAGIASMMFWVRQSGDLGIGVSILSYDGAVQFGVIGDRNLCPDPDLLIERFAPELEQLVMATLLAPWPWAAPPYARATESALFAAREAGPMASAGAPASDRRCATATPDRYWAPRRLP